jgi:hypothetical protein
VGGESAYEVEKGAPEKGHSMSGLSDRVSPSTISWCSECNVRIDKDDKRPGKGQETRMEPEFDFSRVNFIL